MLSEAEKLVKQGKFKNKSALIREALKRLLEGA
jgi:Arc/MetJ-type ribon-helix-helix transcriptional regulator